MNKNNWDNKSTNHYYDTGFGAEMSERGEHGASRPTIGAPPTGGYKPTYSTFDCWQAAYLDLLQIPYLSCTFRNGRPRWFFDNANDAAWKAGSAFRDSADEDGLVPIRRYRQSYRYMQQQVNLAREKGVSYGTDINDSAA